MDLPSFIVSRLENSLSKEKKREVCWWQMFSLQSLSMSRKDDSRDGEMTQKFTINTCLKLALHDEPEAENLSGKVRSPNQPQRAGKIQRSDPIDFMERNSKDSNKQIESVRRIRTLLN